MGNGTHAGIVSNVYLTTGEIVVVEYYTTAVEECGSISIRVVGEKEELRVWADRIDTPYQNLFFSEPTRIVVVRRVLGK